MAELEPAIPKSPQQEPLPVRQQSPDLNTRALHHPIVLEGKETAIHDFLSLGGSKSAPLSIDVRQNGSMQSSITTQDLLHPLQKASGSTNILPAALVLVGSSKPHISAVGFNNGGQQTAYNLVNECVEMQPSYRPSDIISCHVPKAHGPHEGSNNKHWQQQQQQQQRKRRSWGVSEDDDDEDDECFDHGYISKKETGYQKLDDSQQPDGKNMDSKGLTSRSKHSATEQRRRSKINDRFQMLRQLLPNSDQKRDKASFLLEVIEHIQVLHERVKKYEAAEHLGQLVENPKALPWDRTSGCKEGAMDVSNSMPLMYNHIADTTDVNGYRRFKSSPPRIGHGNGNTSQIELTSNGVHASSLSSRLLQAPTCFSSYGNNPSIDMPTLLTFAMPPSIMHGEEPATPPLFQSASSPSLWPEPRTMFARLVHQEEQPAMRVISLHNNEKPIALPGALHQARIPMWAQKSSFLRDVGCEKLKNTEQRPATHTERRSSDEMDEQMGSSLVKDIYQRNSDSTSKECESDKGRTSYGVDGMPTDVNEKGPKGDHQGKVLAHNRMHSAALSGTVNITSPYSQGLLDSLTRALQKSGVDLSQAKISVQIDLGKSSGSAFTASREIATLNNSDLPQSQNSKIGHLREPEPPMKRPKLEADS